MVRAARAASLAVAERREHALLGGRARQGDRLAAAVQDRQRAVHVLLREGPITREQVAVAGVPVEESRESTSVERLHEVAYGAGSQCAAHGGRVVRGGDEDRVDPELADESDAVPVGEVDVGEQEVGACRAHEVARLGAGPRGPGHAVRSSVLLRDTRGGVDGITEPGGEDRAVVGTAGVDDPEVAAAAAGDLRRERQADAVSMHGVPAPVVGARSRIGRAEPLAGVGHRDDERVTVAQHGNVHPPWLPRARDGGHDRVVHEVAEYAGHVLRPTDGADHLGVCRDPQGDAPFGGLDALGPEEGVQERVAHEVESGHGERHRTTADQLVEERPGVVDATGVDEARGHMEAVRELVALDTQRGGHRPNGLQPLGQGDEVGAVAHDQHIAERAPVASHRARLEVQHPVAHDGLRAVASPGGGVAHDRGEGKRVHGAADRIVEPEKPVRRGIAHAHDAVLIDREHAVADAVEHRRLILHEGDQLLGLHADGQPFPAPTQEEEGQQREGEGAGGGQTERGEQRRQVVEDAVALEPDADLADRRAGVVAHRHLRAGGLAERAGLPVDHLVSRQHRGERGAHDLADPRGQRMGESDAFIVRDDDEQGPGAGHDVCGDLLQVSVAQRLRVRLVVRRGDGGDRRPHLRVLGQGPRDAERGRLRLGAQLLDREGEVHARAQRHDEGDGGEVQQQRAGREPDPSPRGHRHLLDAQYAQKSRRGYAAYRAPRLRIP
ncbi:unnamed protein product [Penicillium discolor]